MKTDELIAILGRGDISPDDAAWRRLFVAGGVATVVAVVLMVTLLGVRPTLAADLALPMFWVKALFCIAVALAGVVAVARAGRPGARLRAVLLALAAPFVAIAVLGGGALALAAPAERPLLLLGHSWRECPLNIVLLSLPVLVATLWSMRDLAPTRLRLAGAVAGLAAAGVGAFVYTFHCDELAAPFLAVWYVGGMLVPTIIGAWIGPRVLRW